MCLKNLLANALVFSFLLSACATQSPKVAIAPAPVNVTERLPASVIEENLKISFDLMMNSEDPENEFLSYLERLKSIYVRAEAGLGDFDEELDEYASTNASLSFESSKSYKKMMVMWGIKHDLQDKIIFHYLSLTEMKFNPNIDPAKRKIASNILLKFKRKLDTNDPIEKISFDELKNSIASELKQIRRFAPKSVSSEEIPSESFKTDQEKLKLVRQYRNQLRAMGKSERAKNNELDQKINRDSEKLQLIDQKGREPKQSTLKFFPDTGPNGNVMGLIFPKNVWALTYDDGPHATNTPAIVKNLNELGIKATFFWLAENVVRYQRIVDLVKENDFPVANHSWSHPVLTKLGDEGLQKEIVRSTEVITKSHGEKPKYFRCPYGAGNSVLRIRKMIADLDMIHVYWNVDTLDWQDKDPDTIVARAKKQMKAAGHGVVLFHDIHSQSVIASKKLVEWSKTLKGEEEIRWVTLPEIINEMNGAEK